MKNNEITESSIVKGSAVTNDDQTHSLLCVEKHNRDFIDLTPHNVADVDKMAELWEHIQVKDRDSTEIIGGSTGAGKIEFFGSELFRFALHSLRNEKFKDYISVSAMAFPALICTDKVKKHERYYKDLKLSKNEFLDTIPLSETREGGYGDPWTDGKFPSDAAEWTKTGVAGGKGLPETCIWVKCPECHGDGKVDGISSYFEERGYVTCSVCNGTGKTGAVFCEACHGKGGGYSRRKVEKKKRIRVDCDYCGGTGKVRSVLVAVERIGTTAEEKFIFTPTPSGTIPTKLLDCRTDCSNAVRYKVLPEISMNGKRIVISDESLPNFGNSTSRIKENIIGIQKKLDKTGVRYLSETIRFEHCVRYVRFQFHFFVPSYIDLSQLDGIRKYGVGEFRGAVAESAAKTGNLPPGYFSCRHEFSNTVIWLDTATGETYGEFPEKGDIMEWHSAALRYLLLAMGKCSGLDGKQKKNAKKEKVKPRRKKEDSASTSSKKRWKFVVLGILLGFFGVHLAYAKRWLLFLLLWAGFIAGNVMYGGAPKGETGADTTNVPQVTQAENQEKKSGNPIGGIGFAVWALLWIGGTLLIKKDGKGNRM